MDEAENASVKPKYVGHFSSREMESSKAGPAVEIEPGFNPRQLPGDSFRFAFSFIDLKMKSLEVLIDTILNFIFGKL